MTEEIEAEGTYEILFRKIGEKYYIVGLGKNDNVHEKILNKHDISNDEYFEWLTNYHLDPNANRNEYVIIRGNYQLFKQISKNGFSYDENVKLTGLMNL